MRRVLTRLLVGLGALVGASQALATTVVLDTGHTPSQQGSTSAYGRAEYGFNVQLANFVAQYLQAQGVTVRRVQGEHTLISRTYQTAEADLFVSLHHDSIQQAWIDAGKREAYAGFSVFISHKNPQPTQSLLCARHIGWQMVGIGEVPSRYHALPIAGENRPVLDPVTSVHRYDNLVVLKTAKAPAVLVEAGVIANPHEDRRLGDPKVANQLAGALARGIQACLAK